MMTTMLKSAGHDVVAAAGGTEALQFLSVHEFDLVFTDLGMPGMTGWEVSEAIQRLCPETHVILVTGWGDSVTSEQTEKAGIKRVLSKPFTRSQLQLCIQEVMQTFPSPSQSPEHASV